MIRVLIADDHTIVREGLKHIIGGCSDMTLVGEALDGDEALALAQRVEADVQLLDISMPGPPFQETLSRLRTARPGLRILVLSVHAADQYAAPAIKAGAAGYLNKIRSPEELATAIRCVYEGGVYPIPDGTVKLTTNGQASPQRS